MALQGRPRATRLIIRYALRNNSDGAVTIATLLEVPGIVYTHTHNSVGAGMHEL